MQEIILFFYYLYFPNIFVYQHMIPNSDFYLQGVEVLIDVETYEYFSVHSAGSEGVLVLIQHYRDIPLMRKESFVLSPGNN